MSNRGSEPAAPRRLGDCPRRGLAGAITDRRPRHGGSRVLEGDTWRLPPQVADLVAPGVVQVQAVPHLPDTVPYGMVQPMVARGESRGDSWWQRDGIPRL